MNSNPTLKDDIDELVSALNDFKYIILEALYVSKITNWISNKLK